ncbi:MAG: hypothetical protein HZC36_02205 [Armatimonadetes bacterium]|nr:hypothetical protein [Armatimonadota bacterium]
MKQICALASLVLAIATASPFTVLQGQAPTAKVTVVARPAAKSKPAQKTASKPPVKASSKQAAVKAKPEIAPKKPVQQVAPNKAAQAGIVDAIEGRNRTAKGAAKPTPKLEDPGNVKAPKPSNPEDIPCTVNVANFDLGQVLRLISDETKANLLLLAPPDQKLTLRLSQVPMIEMLKHVCALTGLRYLKVGDTYAVAAEAKLKSAYPAEWALANPDPPKVAEPVKPEPPKPVTKLVTMSNITADKAADVLGKAFAKERLTVIPGPQYTSPSLSARESAAATGVSGTAVERTDEAGKSKSLVLIGAPEDVALAEDVLKRIDLARRQVVIQVSIHDITNDALRDVGLGPWSFSDINLSESTPNGVNFGSISRASQSVTAQIRALEKSSAAKLLASPSLSVLDGESAFILIGDKINYPVLVGYSQSNAPIFSKETEKVGIYLQLSCQVSEDGTITLALYPQVSTITGYLEVNGASYPQIATREAQTTLRFKSGETVVMGGLLKDEDVTSVERTPLLSKIPLLGEIFTHRKKTKTSSQVIISITPTILPGQGK